MVRTNNPLIPMSVKPLEIGNSIIEGLNARNQRENNTARTEAVNKQADSLDRRTAIMEEEAKAKKQLRTLASLGSAGLELMPYLASEDIDGARNYLTRRIERLDRNEIDSSDSREALEMLNNGQVKELTRDTYGAIQEAFNRGALQAQKTDLGPLVQGIGDDGESAFFQQDKNTGKFTRIEGFTPPAKQPFGSITTPDGTQITLGGSAPSQATEGRRVSELEVLSGSLDSLARIRESYSPELVTLPAKLQAGATTLQSLAGMKIAPEDRAQAEGVIKLKATIAREQSATLNRLSGAAVSPAEAKRIESFVVATGDGPIEIETKLSGMEKAVEQAMMRANYLRHLGRRVDKASFQEFPLESIESIARNRAKEIRENLSRQHPDKTRDEINKLMRAQMRLEFGN